MSQEQDQASLLAVNLQTSALLTSTHSNSPPDFEGGSDGSVLSVNGALASCPPLELPPDIAAVLDASPEDAFARARLALYFSHFLSTWGQRMWEFAVSLIMLELYSGGGAEALGVLACLSVRTAAVGLHLCSVRLLQAEQITLERWVCCSDHLRAVAVTRKLAPGFGLWRRGQPGRRAAGVDSRRLRREVSASDASSGRLASPLGGQRPVGCGNDRVHSVLFGMQNRISGPYLETEVGC
jgi:Ferroportin1 (FPN1)